MRIACLALFSLLVSCGSDNAANIREYLRQHPERAHAAPMLHEGILVEGMNPDEVRLIMGRQEKAVILGQGINRRMTMSFKGGCRFNDKSGRHELEGPVSCIFVDEGEGEASSWSLEHVKSIWR
ncbi:MAG: hypothetical protein AB7F75_03630 [Planctomycetota bacterium]